MHCHVSLLIAFTFNLKLLNSGALSVQFIMGDLSSFALGLRKHDVCFLITIRPNLLYGTRFDRRQPFVEQTGLAYVRGCEVQGMLDEKGRVIEEGKHTHSHNKKKMHGSLRY